MGYVTSARKAQSKYLIASLSLFNLVYLFVTFGLTTTNILIQCLPHELICQTHLLPFPSLTG